MAIARIQFEFIWVGLVRTVEGERGIILHGNHKYSSASFIFKTLPHCMFTIVKLLTKSHPYYGTVKYDADHMVVNFESRRI